MHVLRRTGLTALFLFASAPPTAALAESTADDSLACVRRALCQDDILGRVRNHATENRSLAEAIRDYVRGLELIELQGCDESFSRALLAHRDAWQRSIGFFEQHPALRGEMHALLATIRARDDTTRERLEEVEADIWGTWEDVETMVDRLEQDVAEPTADHHRTP